MFLSLFISRLILKNLGALDYGVYGVVGSIVTMFTFFNMAMTTAGQRCLSVELGKVNGNFSKVFSTLLVICLVIALVVTIILQVFGPQFIEKLNIPENRIEVAKVIFHASCITFVLNTLQIPFTASLISNEKISSYSLITLLDIFLRFFLAFGLSYVLAEKLSFYAYGIAFITLFVLLINVFISLSNSRLVFTFERKYYKEIGSFFGWNLLGGLASVSLYQGIQIVLNLFFNPVVNAAQSLTIQIKSAIEGFAANIRTASNPQIIKNCVGGNIQSIIELLNITTKLSTIVILVIAVPLFFRIDFILKFWLGAPPDYTALFIKLYLINAIIDVVTSPLVTVIQAIGNLKIYQVLTSVVLLSVIPISYILFENNFPPQAYTIVLICATILTMIIRVGFIFKILKIAKIKFFLSVINQILIVPLISYLILYFVNSNFTDNLIGLVLFSITSSFVILSVSYIVILNKLEKTKIKMMFLAKLKNN